MDGTILLPLYPDKEGYLSYECPFCGSRFKLCIDEMINNNQNCTVSDLFCPICGLVAEKSMFISRELRNAAEDKAYNYMADKLNTEFGKLARVLNHKNGLIRMTVKPMINRPEKEVMETEEVETRISCKVCNRSVKLLDCAGVSIAFCPYCGVNI